LAANVVGVTVSRDTSKGAAWRPFLIGRSSTNRRTCQDRPFRLIIGLMTQMNAHQRPGISPTRRLRSLTSVATFGSFWTARRALQVGRCKLARPIPRDSQWEKAFCRRRGFFVWKFKRNPAVALGSLNESTSQLTGD